MSLFGNLTDTGLEETKDVLGGFVTYDTDIYKATVSVAYAGKSDGGAQSVTLILDIGNKREYRETVYVTNRNGENFFYNKNDKTKKVGLPGFTLIDDLCLMTTNEPLAKQKTEDKVLKIYDPAEKKEQPKSVPVLVDLMGKTVYVAIAKELANKSEKDGKGVYVATAETREENHIVKVFHDPSMLTVPEAREQRPATFHEAWLEKNKGQIKDKRTIKDGQAAKSGRPPQGGAPAGGEKKTTSLFGK